MRSKNNQTKDSKTKLPWWVEILFVQIGLPDYLLRSFLKTKRTSKKLLKENKASIGYLLLITGFLVYINPIIKQSQNNNSCVSLALEKIKISSSEAEKANPTLNIIKANNACNGGKIELQ